MAIEINIGQKASTMGIAGTGDFTISSQSTQESSKILTGDSVKVTSGAMTDLEALVEKLKNESEDTRLSVTQRRISILGTVLDSMADKISEAERQAIADIETLEGEKSELQNEITDLNVEKTASEGRITALDIQIAALEKQIEQAVQDGADHREQVAKLKEQRAEEQSKLDQVEAAIQSASSRIAGIDVKITELTDSIGATTLSEISKAFRAAASDGSSSTSVDRTEDNADRVEDEKEAEATDIAAAISEALDRIDRQITKALDEAQMKVEG